MTTIVTRAGKGSPLSNAEVDQNFSGLNTDKLELGGTFSSGTANSILYLNASKVLTTGSALTFDGTEFKVNAASGNVLVQPSNVANAKLYMRHGSIANNSGFEVDASSNIIFLHAASELMRLTSTGLKSSIAGTNSDPVFSYTSDTNTGVFFPAADKLGFVAGGGTNDMVLTTTGLGIGTATPAQRLEVSNGGPVASTQITTLRVSGAGDDAQNLEFYQNWSTATGVRAKIGSDGDGVSQQYGTLKFYTTRNTATGVVERMMLNSLGTLILRQSSTPANTSVSFNTTVQNALTLDSSGNLGLGVTPSAWTATHKAIQLPGGGGLYNNGADGYLNLANNFYYDGTDWRRVTAAPVSTYLQSSSGHLWGYTGTGAANSICGFPTEQMRLSTDGTFRVKGAGTAGSTDAVQFSGSAPASSLILDSSGNLGVGQTSMSQPLEIKRGAGVAAFIEVAGNNNTPGSTSAVYGQDASGNAFAWNRADSPLLFGTNNTERARITSGGNLELKRASNSAQNSVIFDTTVQNALTLTSGGVFCVGTTDYQLASNRTASFLGVAGIECVATGTGGEPCVEAWQKATSGDNVFEAFYTETSATNRGSIDYNRAGGLVRYNTTSDYRAKDILGPLQNVGATIDALKVYEGKMKGATQSRPMLVAHEAQEHAPYAVSGVKDEVNDDGTPKFQQMDVSSLVPLLLAEIQSLRARVAQLESKGA